MRPSQRAVLDAVVASERLAIVTDFDGTLVPIAARPELAVPTPAVLDLLAALVRTPGVTVTVASGRPRDALEAMLGAVQGLALAAEHGAWLRDPGGAWRPGAKVGADGLDRLADGLDRLARQFQGAFVERKTSSLALHHRLVAEGEREALRVAASALIDEQAGPELERLDGKEVIELRPRHVHKGQAVRLARAAAGPGARVLALGDDVTDEDMFAALEPQDAGVLVAAAPGRPSLARHRLSGVDEVHQLLEWVRDARLGGGRSRRPSVHDAAPEGPAAPAGGAFDLLVVSNRLPELRASTSPDDDRRKSVGGLVSALRPALEARRGVWLGWSGRTVRDDAGDPTQSVDASTTPALSWLDLPERWQRRYYDGLCNGALWPALHSFPSRVRYDERDLAAYREANAAFAAAALRLVAPGGTVWLHDYHLLLLGAELRRRGHRGPIGLFLHVPFCAPDIVAVLPCAEELVRGLLALDLVGFHTRGYADNFLRACAALPGVRVEGDLVASAGRTTRVGVFPIGIIPEQFQPRSGAPAQEVEELLRVIAGRRLVLGVDRLDYTKGIPERLTAFGRLLETHPEWRGRVCLVQVSVPSRADVPEYARQRALIEGIVGRVNGEHGEANWVPIRYLYRSYGADLLAQLYRAADVGYVTPLRDGMNLVAKEYVAAQDPASPGVLVLSRFAGAADELDAALLTNPYDADGMARDLDRALRMELAERVERHRRLRAAVEGTTALTWADDFLAALEATRTAPAAC